MPLTYTDTCPYTDTHFKHIHANLHTYTRAPSTSCVTRANTNACERSLLPCVRPGVLVVVTLALWLRRASVRAARNAAALG